MFRLKTPIALIIFSILIAATANGQLFGPGVDYSSGVWPYSAFSMDFNNDKYIDVAVANMGSNTVVIFLNNGDGSFHSPITYSVPANPRVVHGNDFDGDGDIDLAVGCTFSSGYVSVLLNNGDGTFMTAQNYSCPSPVSLVTDDYNGDNHIDIAVTNYDNYSLGILINNGNGTFQSPYYIFGSYLNWPKSIASADFDIDGDNDLAAINLWNDVVSLFKNDGNGNFVNTGNYHALQDYNGDLLFDDFNNDSYPDIAVTSLSTITIMLNSTNGDIGSYKYITGMGSQLDAICSGDFNRDGYTDLAFSNRIKDSIGYALNGTNTSFQFIEYFESAYNNMSINSADYDIDGYLDLGYVDSPSSGIGDLTISFNLTNYICGDVNNDDLVDTADVDYLVAYMFMGGPPPIPLESGDVNCNPGIDISDLVWLVEYVYHDGPAPCDCDGKEAKINGLEVTFKAVYEDGFTYVTMSSPVDLSGLQIELDGNVESIPVNISNENLDLMFDNNKYGMKIGMLDLKGDKIISSGKQSLIRIKDEHSIKSVVVVDTDGNTVSARIIQNESLLPMNLVLHQNYPNPFNPTTIISAYLPKASDYSMTIYNISGQKVDQFTGHSRTGKVEIIWDASDNASGVYLYKFEAGEFSETKKMILLK